MGYLTGHALRPRNLFIRFKREYLKTTGGDRKDILCARVFTYFMYILLLDIIHNSVTFRIPVNNSEVFIEMAPVTDNEFVKARQNGAFQEVDYLESNFSAYILQLRFNVKNGTWREKRIYVSNVLKNIITDYTNKGKKY